MAESVFKWIKDGDLMITVNSAGNVSDEVWSEFMLDLGADDYKCYLGGSLGILEVAGKQRKQAAAALRKNKVNLVILTDDVLVRGIVTAVSWLGANVKSFPWSNIERALAHLDLSDRSEQVMTHIRKLRTEVTTEFDERKRQRREHQKR